MAKGKKTFQVEEVKSKFNDMLKNGTQSKEERYGLISALEMILKDSGNYNGFMYLSERDVPKDELPGIRENNDFTNTDETRRKYF